MEGAIVTIRMRHGIKAITHLAIVIAWFVFANHCILADAFAAPQKSGHQHSHCHGEDGTKGKTQGHHSKCKDNGCCQPALQASFNSGSLSLAPVQYAPVLSFHDLTVSISHISNEVLGSTFEATGPPARSEIHLLGLSLAPNAPPYSSTHC